MADNQAQFAQSDDMVIHTQQARVSCNGGGGAWGIRKFG